MCQYVQRSAATSLRAGAADAASSTSVTSAAKPVATIAQLADYLINGFWQYNGTMAHHWGSSTITYNISGLNANEQMLAQSALNAWHEVANLTFVQTTGAANITFTHNGTMTAYDNRATTAAPESSARQPSTSAPTGSPMTAAPMTARPE